GDEAVVRLERRGLARLDAGAADRAGHHHLHEGRLAGAVHPDEPDPVALVHRERHPAEHPAVAEALPQILDGEDRAHGERRSPPPGGSPSSMSCPAPPRAPPPASCAPPSAPALRSSPGSMSMMSPCGPGPPGRPAPPPGGQPAPGNAIVIADIRRSTQRPAARPSRRRTGGTRSASPAAVVSGPGQARSAPATAASSAPTIPSLGASPA